LADRSGGERAGAVPAQPGAGSAGEIERMRTRLRRAERDRRNLLRQLLTAQEDERRRLAGDLHDDAVQSLAAALLHLDVLDARLERAGAGGLGEVHESVARVRQSLEHGLRAARAFLLDLRPPPLHGEGLRAALGQQLERLAECTACTTELDWQVDAQLDADLATVLFRVLQEALANVAKHARPSAVRVRARSDGNAVAVRVDDDGVGFDPVAIRARAVPTGHLGLRFMAERMEAAGGDLLIESAPARGTRVTLRLPTRPAGAPERLPRRDGGPTAAGG